MTLRARIAGVGSYLPKQIVTNADLSKRVDTSDEWIRERTGIHQRHIAEENETTSDLGFAAAQSALEDAGMAVDDLDLIVVATTTPDFTFPSTATIIQNRLGMTHGAAFDVQAVCSGFIFAISIANNFILSGQAKNVLVIGAETYSRILDWTDRTTCVLFGDGAGAFVLCAEETDDPRAGIINTQLRSDGRYRELLYVDGGPSRTQTVGHLRMKGNQVFRHAVSNISSAMQTCADEAGVGVDEIDWFVPHQANQRILDGVARKLGADRNKIVTTVKDHANTSAASIPLAMHAAIQDGRIQRGQMIMLEAFGGGFTWGAALFRY